MRQRMPREIRQDQIAKAIVKAIRKTKSLTPTYEDILDELPAPVSTSLIRHYFPHSLDRLNAACTIDPKIAKMYEDVKKTWPKDPSKG